MDRRKSRGGKSQGGEEQKWEDQRREKAKKKEEAYLEVKKGKNISHSEYS